MESNVSGCVKMNSEVTIIDYGAGNVHSVQGALAFLGCKSRVESDPIVIETSEALILPGVGSFPRAMDRLREKKIDDAILEAVVGRKIKILGICLGMQRFAESSDEDGGDCGLSLIPGSITRFDETVEGVKVPHIGFNNVAKASESRLFKDLDDLTDFYFVHSYRLELAARPGIQCTCDYGGTFVASYESDNVFCTQFHPEKSQTSGLTLIRNFLAA